MAFPPRRNKENAKMLATKRFQGRLRSSTSADALAIKGARISFF